MPWFGFSKIGEETQNGGLHWFRGQELYHLFVIWVSVKVPHVDSFKL